MVQVFSSFLPSPVSEISIFASEVPVRRSCDGVGFLNEYPAVRSCNASTVFVLPAAFFPTKIVVCADKSISFEVKQRKLYSETCSTLSPTQPLSN